MRSLSGKEFMPNRTRSGGLYSIGKRFGECFCGPVAVRERTGATGLSGVHELEEAFADGGETGFHKWLPTGKGLCHESAMAKMTKDAVGWRLGGLRDMKRVAQLFLGWLLVGGALAGMAGDVESYATRISSLVDPAKLATLGSRGANSRVEKYVAILAEGKADGVAPKKVAAKAMAIVGMK